MQFTNIYFVSALIPTLLYNLCFTKKSTSVAMGSPAHTDSLTTTITTKVTDIRRGSTIYSVGYATPTSFTSSLHGFCNSQKPDMSFVWALQPT